MFTLAGNFYKWVKKSQEKSLTIILLGLDNAGKSTLLYGLKNEMPKSDVTPTIGFRPSKLVSGKYTIQWFDVGGAKNFRRVWQNYYSEVHGVIYVVDGADLDRIEEAKETLAKTLDSEGIPGKPVLIFSNKQDLPGCLSAADLSEKLGMLERKDCRHHVAPCQAKPSEGGAIDKGIGKGLRWLLDSIDSNYKQLNSRVLRETEEVKKKEKERREEQKKRAEANKAARLKEQAEAEAAAAAQAAAAQEGGIKPDQQAAAGPDIVVEGAGAAGLAARGKAAETPSEKGQAAEHGAQVEVQSAGTNVKGEVKAPAKLEIEDGAAAPQPRMLPSLDGSRSPARSASPGPRLNDLKALPPVQNPAVGPSPDLVLPNAIPSPETKRVSVE